MKLKRYLILLLAVSLLIVCMTGCQREQIPDVYTPRDTSDDEVIPGRYLPPTEKTIVKADRFLKKQRDKVRAFWEKNQEVLETAAAECCSMYEMYPEREYCYSIARKDLISALILPDDDAEETVCRAKLKTALERVSNLKNADIFERIYMNCHTLTLVDNHLLNAEDVSFCEFTGALKLYDGIGCYVSLAYFPDGEPSNKKTNEAQNRFFEMQMLDDTWALMTFEQTRDELGIILPWEKCAEVQAENLPRQAWALYEYWKENRTLLEQIATEMIRLTKQENASFDYSVMWDEFQVFTSDSKPYQGEDASETVLNQMRSLSEAALIREIRSGSPYQREDCICMFDGQMLYVDGYDYYASLVYTTDNSQEVKPDSSIMLDRHWYLDVWN